MSISIKGESTGLDSTISSFLKSFKSIARTNRFEVEIMFPAGINLNGIDNVDRNSILQNTYANYSMSDKIAKYTSTLKNKKILSFGCNSMIMPGKNINTVIDNTHNTKFPTNYNVEPVSFSFIENDRLEIKEFFVYWQSMITSYSNKTIFFYNDYISQYINLYQLDRSGKRTFKVILEEAYPTSIASVDYSHNSDDSYIQTTVSFTYKNWKISTLTGDIQIPSLTPQQIIEGLF